MSLRDEQTKDEKAALHWWDTTRDDVKQRIWDFIQQDFLNMPGTQMKASKVDLEIMSRLAQIGYTHIALLAEKRTEAN